MATSLRLANLLPDGTEKSSLWLRPAVATGLDTIVTQSYDLGFPDIRESSEEYAGRDGVSDRSYYTSARSVTFNVTVFTRGAVTKEDLISQLRSYVSPKSRTVLYLRNPSWDRDRRMLLRGVRAGVATGRKNVSFQEMTLEFVCPSGFIESADQFYEDVNPAVSMSGGLAFGPTISFDPTVSFGDIGSGGEKTIMVEGTESTPPIFVITGGCSNPSIRHIDLDKELRFTGLTFGPGSTLVIDTESQQILLDGVTYYSKLDFTNSRWWNLINGENNIRFSPETSDASCSLRIYYRDRWI